MSTESKPADDRVLEHLDWVRGLALALVGDAGVADDLAQDAWSLARAKPPARAVSLRGWLARVTRNLAREHLRRERRRARHERAGARAEALPSSAEIAERVELERRVARELLRLREPQRHALLLRYFEGFSPRAIAAQLGVPEATVKTRLRRGLAELRERLDVAHGGDRGAWVIALAPLAERAGVVSAGVALMGTKLAIVAAAGLLALTLWLASRPEQREGVELAASGSPSSDAQRDLGAGANGEPISSVARSFASGTAQVGREATGDEIELQVVDRASGKPLAKAELWIVPAAIASESERLISPLELYDLEVDARRSGRRVACDEAGRAVIARPREYACVSARLGELYGEGSFAPTTPSPLRIECSRDRSLSILVVDTDGRPVKGVPVGLNERSGINAQLIWGALTGADGIARLAHFDRAIGDRLDTAAEHFACLAFPMRETVEEPIGLEELPNEAIRLVVPPTGSLAIKLVDGEGSPFSVETWLNVTALVPDPSGRERPIRGQEVNRYLRGESAALFPHVGLGLELRVELRDLGPHESVDVAVTGPRAAGERVVARVRCGDPLPALAGRIAHPPELALQRATLDARIAYRAEDGRDVEDRERAKVKPDGSFHLPLSRTTPGVELHVRLEGEFGAELQRLSGDIRATAPAPGKVQELGTIQMSLAPLVASGVVLDAAGAPLFWAQVDLRRRIGTPRSAELRWDFTGTSGVMTREDGSFELRGEFEPGEYGLWVRKQGFSTHGTPPFPLGTRGLTIVLEAEASLAGSVVVDPGFPVERLAFAVLESGDASPPWRSDQLAHVTPSGRFEMSGLAHGGIDLALVTGEHSEPFLRIREVELEPGETTRDPRVQELDLRGRLFVFDFDVVGPEGSAVLLGFVTLLPPADSGRGPRRYALENGRVSSIVDTPSVDVDIFSPGLRRAELRGLRTGRRVALERGLPVRVRLPGDFELLAPPIELWVGFHPADWLEHRDWRAFAEDDAHEHSLPYRGVAPYARFDGARETEVGLPGPGEYEVLWLVVDDSAEKNGSDVLGVLRSRREGDAPIALNGEPCTLLLAPDEAQYRDASRR